MMTEKDPIYEVMEDLKKRLLTASIVKEGKCTQVYSEKELKDKTKAIPLPAIGLVYEGMRSNQTGDNANSNSSVSCMAVVSVILLTDKKNQAGGTSAEAAHTLIGSCRNVIKNQRAPTGHKYKFVVEAPASEDDSTVLWVQRWTVATQI